MAPPMKIERETRSKVSTPLMFAPPVSMVIWPLPETLKPLSVPSALKSASPVVSVTRGVLMKPQPLQVTPAGLARMKSALWPKISV